MKTTKTLKWEPKSNTDRNDGVCYLETTGKWSIFRFKVTGMKVELCKFGTRLCYCSTVAEAKQMAKILN